MIKGRLDGKSALITGSTRGIGEQLAYGFAREGAKAAVSGRTVQDGQRVVEKIRATGGTAEFIALDLTDESIVKKCIQRMVARFGALDILVNNAMPSERVTGGTAGENGNLMDKSDAAIADLTTERWRKIMLPGLDGLFWVLRYAIPELQKSGGGSIVNISSIASLQGVGGTDAYTPMKGAMNSLTGDEKGVSRHHAGQGNCSAQGHGRSSRIFFLRRILLGYRAIAAGRWRSHDQDAGAQSGGLIAASRWS